MSFSVWQVWAMVSDGEVKNIIVAGPQEAIEIVRACYGPDAVAIEVNQYPVQIGDTRDANGVFWRTQADGTKTEIMRVPTAEENAGMALKQAKANNAQVEYLAMMTGNDMDV